MNHVRCKHVRALHSQSVSMVAARQLVTIIADPCQMVTAL